MRLVKPQLIECNVSGSGFSAFRSPKFNNNKMNIEAQKFNIEMSHEELWNTAFDVRRSIEHTLQTHWVYHQANWEHNENERLNRCKTMFLALGRPELHEEVFNKAKEIFKAFNDKRGS
jgi:hypothetical protein